mmetsp:Transcript_10336/g.23242  ORF Transcript_10336/g.23242 Transcript_10336/m.23242 type:complete len:113 (+) Transcript_10336:146-484(+)
MPCLTHCMVRGTTDVPCGSADTDLGAGRRLFLGVTFGGCGSTICAEGAACVPKASVSQSSGHEPPTLWQVDRGADPREEPLALRLEAARGSSKDGWSSPKTLRSHARALSRS